MNTNGHSRMCFVKRTDSLKKNVRDLVGRVGSVLRLYSAERDVVHSVFPELHLESHYQILIFVASGIEREHILVETADAVHPIPQIEEPNELSRLVQVSGNLPCYLAAVRRNF